MRIAFNGNLGAENSSGVGEKKFVNRQSPTAGRGIGRKGKTKAFSGDERNPRYGGKLRKGSQRGSEFGKPS